MMTKQIPHTGTASKPIPAFPVISGHGSGTRRNEKHPSHGAGARRRTRGEIAQLEAQIVAILEDDHPQSVRHVFYRLTDPRLPVPVSKTERGYRQVMHRLTEMRRAGRLPYGWIADSTRRGHHVTTFQSAADFIRESARLYRGDLWRGVLAHVEVWTESRSLAGVLQADCRDLAVSLYPAGGFASLSFIYEAAQEIEATGKQAVYAGDYDPAGLTIDRNIERGLREHLPAHDIRFERIAITEAQIAAYDLPTKPRKPGDRRRLDIRETVEAEAMPAHVLRQLLRDAVEAYLPAGALAAVKVAEYEEQSGLQALAEVMGQGEAWDAAIAVIDHKFETGR